MAVSSDIQFDLVATSPLKRMMFASSNNTGVRVPDMHNTTTAESHASSGRKRSNSQSRVVALPTGIGSHPHMIHIDENGAESSASENGPLGRRDSLEAIKSVSSSNSGTDDDISDSGSLSVGSAGDDNNKQGFSASGGHMNGINTGLNITSHRASKPSNSGSDTSSSQTPASSALVPPSKSKSKSSSGSSKGYLANSQLAKDSSAKEGKRSACEYMVTLILLNDTFVKKQLHVPYFPETMKLGRPIGAKIKPDVNNGYFDSRVLSRNHADLYIDSATGDLMLKDLNSSNGTFVNDVKLGAEPVVLHIGDTVHLGFNIQAESNHKQISVRVENINIITNYMGNNMMWNDRRSKHVEYVKNIYNQLCTMEREDDVYEMSAMELSSKKNVTFDNALFGDINPKFEDNLLGLFNKNGAGFFNNSQIINNTAMESVLNILTLSLSEVRQQNNTLKSLEDYIRRYLTQADALAQRHINDITKRKFNEMDTSFHKERQHHRSVKLDYKHYKEESEHKIGLLENENFELANEIGELKDTVLMLQQMIASSSSKNEEKNIDVPVQNETGTGTESRNKEASIESDPVESLDNLAAQLSEVIEKPKDVDDDDDIEVHQLEKLLNSSETLEDRDDSLNKETDMVRAQSPVPRSATPPPPATGTTSRSHAAVLGISAVLISVLIHRLSH